MKRLIIIFIICLLLPACAYNGALNSSAYSPLNNPDKIPVTVALGGGGKVMPIQQGAQGMSFDIGTKDAVMGASQKVLNNAFSRIGTSCVDSQYIAEPSFRLSFADMNGWTGRYSYDSDLCLLFYRCGQDGVIAEHCDRQRLDFNPTPANTILSFITGLSLFTLAPITMPIITQIAGANAVETGNQTLGRSFDIIQTDIIRNRNKFVTPPNEGIPAAISHSGRTNKDGCHWDHKTGTYHCH